MGLVDRVKSIFRAKANSILNELEDPEEALELSLEELREQLNKINKSLIEVTTVKKRLESNLSDIRNKIRLAQEQADLSITSNREDLAQAALAKKMDLTEQEERISKELKQLEEKIKMIAANKEKLQRHIYDLQNKKEELIVMNRAADAQIMVKEAIAGVSSDILNINQRIARAQEKIKEKNNRVAAMDELIEINALDVLYETDPIQEELYKIQKEERIKQELEQLKKKKGVL